MVESKRNLGLTKRNKTTFGGVMMHEAESRSRLGYYTEWQCFDLCSGRVAKIADVADFYHVPMEYTRPQIAS